MNIQFSRTALENEFAIIYAYGVIAARMGSEYESTALNALTMHRSIRDQLIDYLLSQQQTLPVAGISYSVPTITNSNSGARAGQLAEQQSCRAYRNLIAHTSSPDLKRPALSWLINSTQVLSQWESILHHTIFVEAFPGSG